MSHRSILDFTGAFRDSICACMALGNGYRWYLPALMRFNATDSLSPFGAGGPNAYAYCHTDPINYNDPTGHISWLPAGNDVRLFVTRDVTDDEPIATREARGAARPAPVTGREAARQIRPREESVQAGTVAHVQRKMIAVKKPRGYPFYRVVDKPELIDTLEGRRTANVGDFVLEGIKGERWPIRFEEFNARYQYEGSAGIATPNTAAPTRVIAEQMSAPFTVTPPWSNDPLSLKAGDIRVTVMGDPRNSWGVDQDIFFETYDILEG